MDGREMCKTQRFEGTEPIETQQQPTLILDESYLDG
jgi:hypothetical protein